MRKNANKKVQMTRGLPLLPAQPNFLIQFEKRRNHYYRLQRDGYRSQMHTT